MNIAGTLFNIIVVFILAYLISKTCEPSIELFTLFLLMMILGMISNLPGGSLPGGSK